MLYFYMPTHCVSELAYKDGQDLTKIQYRLENIEQHGIQYLFAPPPGCKKAQNLENKSYFANFSPFFP